MPMSVCVATASMRGLVFAKAAHFRPAIANAKRVAVAKTSDLANCHAENNEAERLSLCIKKRLDNATLLLSTMLTRAAFAQGPIRQ